MAITATNLAAAHDTTNRTSTAYSTASISFVAGRVYMLAVRARVASGTPAVGSITGGGNTWTLLQTSSQVNVTLWLYYCVAASTTSDTISITPDGVTTWTQAGWIVDEFTNAAAVAQSAQNSNPSTHTSLTVTLPGFFYPATSVAYGVFAHNEDTALTAGSGFTDLGASTEASENANRIKSIYKVGEDTGVDITSASTSSDVFGVAAEISESVPNFPAVEDVTTSYFSAATAHAVNMPASVTAGQLLFVVLGIDQAATITTPSGWTVVEDSTTRCKSYARISDGTEGGTTVDFVTATSREMAAHVYRISNWYGTISTGVFAGTPNGSSAGNPDCPTLDPGLGGKEFLWIAAVGHTTNGATINSAPTNYLGYTETNDPPGANDIALASAYRQMYESTEDPGTFPGTTIKTYNSNTFAILVKPPIDYVTLSTKIATAESFGTATLRATINPSAIATGVAFGTHELQAGAASITPDLIASAEAFGSHELLQISVISLQGNGIASEEAFGTHELQPGAVNISPDAIATAESFGTHSLQAAIRPDGIISAEAFGTPYFISHISPSGIATAEAFGTVIFLRYILPSAIATAESFGTAELQPGVAYISPSAIATLESFGLHRLAKALAGRIPPPPGLAGDGAGLQPGVSAFRVNPPSGQSKSGLWLPPGV